MLVPVLQVPMLKELLVGLAVSMEGRRGSTPCLRGSLMLEVRMRSSL
jgi:hypothetical protein